MNRAPDLRKEFPRSPTVVLGGYVLLARTLDKCRAEIAGTVGEYHYNCPLDQQFFGFTGISADEFKAFVAQGKSDEEVAAWVKQKTPQFSEEDVLAWSYDMMHRRPEDKDGKAFFEGYRRKFSPHKPYISTWFELLDAEEQRLR